MSKKNLFGKMTYSQRFNTSGNTELSEEDEGLPALIADIQVSSTTDNANFLTNLCNKTEHVFCYKNILKLETGLF